MTTQEERARRRLRDHLNASEDVVHAVLAFRIGGAKEHVSLGGAGLAGGLGRLASSAVTSADAGPADAPELPVPQRCFIVLTNHRLLVMTLGGFVVAGPKKVLHSLPFSAIDRVSDPVKDGYLAGTSRVIVGLTTGMVLRWEFPRIQIKRGDALLADLRHHLSAP
ncbi:MAG: hypothetical protein QOI21_1329 [Actinomycetota bacterium]|jgi:hypothetical protein|uniref:hypothetical protein n=1 Tax=Amycolatopsis sp. TaxID=37632 RepID=UPI0028C59000|nr:hypothetical protein [Actinomycetota bacterium]HEV7976385.1 hypothetical protein [Amycolatopsis sp.]